MIVSLYGGYPRLHEGGLLRRCLVMLVLGCLAIVSCKGSTAEPKSVFGRYVIATINGNPPPQLVYVECKGYECPGATHEVLSGSLTLNPDMTYTFERVWRAYGLLSPDTEQGRFTREQSQLTFFVPPTSPYPRHTMGWFGDRIFYSEDWSTLSTMPPALYVFTRDSSATNTATP